MIDGEGDFYDRERSMCEEEILLMRVKWCERQRGSEQRKTIVTHGTGRGFGGVH